MKWRDESLSNMLSRIFNLDSEDPRVRSNKTTNCTKQFLDSRTILRNFKALIYGPHECGKTSLLFALAISLAEQDLNVLFLCPTKLSKLPILLEGKEQPSTAVLQRIQFVYLKSKEEYLKYMSSVHVELADKTFHCVIADDLGSYIVGAAKNEDVTILARLLAYTVDAFDVINKQNKNSDGNPSMLLVSAAIPESNPVIPKRTLHIYQRWLEHVLRIRPLKQKELQENKQYKLSVISSEGENESFPFIDIHYEMRNTNFSVCEVLDVTSPEKI